MVSGKLTALMNYELEKRNRTWRGGGGGGGEGGGGGGGRGGGGVNKCKDSSEQESR